MSETHTEKECTERADKAWESGLKQGQAASAAKVITLEAKIAELESELYKLKLYAHDGPTGIDAIVEKADQDRRQYEARIADIADAFAQQQELINSIIPPEILKRPIEVKEENRKALAQYVTEHTKDLPGLLPVTISWQHDCLVSLVAFVRTGTTDDDLFYYRLESREYPGSFEEFKKETSWRLRALMCRAPMPEDLRGKSIPGVDEQFRYRAIFGLAADRYSKAPGSDYFKRFDTAYENLIRPLIDPHRITNDAARRAFREGAKETFQQVEKRGRGDATMNPQGKSGRVPRRK